MNPIATLNTINEAAFLAGIFDWNVGQASYTNPDGSTVSFHVIKDFGAPIEQYIAGEVNTFNLVNNALGNPAGISDPNIGLFNTQLTSTQLTETIQRKYTVNRIPYANYDQPVDLGMGGQEMNFTVLFAGTMYQTAMLNIIQCLFNNTIAGLGTLVHPFYQKVMRVLPVTFRMAYTYQSLNFVLCNITFVTSDLSHLNPSALKNNLAAEIGQWYIGIQNAILSMGGTVAALNSTINQISGLS